MTVVYIDQWKKPSAISRSHWSGFDEHVFDMYVHDGYAPTEAAHKIEEQIADREAAKTADNPLLFLARAALRRAKQESGNRR